MPGFGDPDGRIVTIGLTPAAHGANRTGRMFTGDGSGDFLYAGLYQATNEYSHRSAPQHWQPPGMPE